MRKFSPSIRWLRPGTSDMQFYFHNVGIVGFVDINLTLCSLRKRIRRYAWTIFMASHSALLWRRIRRYSWMISCGINAWVRREPRRIHTSVLIRSSWLHWYNLLNSSMVHYDVETKILLRSLRQPIYLAR